MYSKADIRKTMGERVKSLLPEERKIASRSLCEKIVNSLEYIRSDGIFAFYPYKEEIDIRPLLQDALDRGITVCLPRIEGKRMDFHEIKSLAPKDLLPNRWEIYEPHQATPLKRSNDFTHPFMLVPGTAFTTKGKRLGRGGGYYDRYLVKTHNIYLAGVGYPCQMREKLPTEPHDIEMDIIFY
jgi:5-formyltetrahydrofolate cyclo-ligase